MKIEASPVRQVKCFATDGKTINAMDVNFNIFLSGVYSKHIDLCVRIDEQGKFINFPVVKKLNTTNPMVYVELGRVIQHILGLEGNQIKKYCDNLFNVKDKTSLTNCKKCNIKIKSNSNKKD